MKLEKEHIESLDENKFSEDPELEELDNLEDNMKFYTWLSILTGIIWVLSIIISYQ